MKTKQFLKIIKLNIFLNKSKNKFYKIKEN